MIIKLMNSERGFISPILVLVGIVVVLGLIGGAYYLKPVGINVSPSPSKSPSPQANSPGILQGSVSFVGLACPPKEVSGSTLQVPPCDGLYPNYEIIIYKSDGKSVFSKTTTDQDGKYGISIAAGTYIIYTRNGPFKESVETHRVEVRPYETVNLDLVIDTGIR